MSIQRLVQVVATVVVAVSVVAGVRGQGATAPILVVLNNSAPNPFGAYLPEVLRAEGINTFNVVQLSALTAPTLQAAALVVLAETPLTAPQAQLFTNYVAGGGRLVAMRPDPQLAGVLGISPVAGSTADGYVLIDQSGPGAGLHQVTLPFKGVADHFAAAGATTVATLYATRDLSANRPAVVRHNRTAAWSFDLARSTAYIRQGDPAFAGLDRDGRPFYSTDDIFFQTIDLERVGVPHADVQMRLFSRVIADLLADSQPLPQLWYFPGTSRTLLVPTSDSHTSWPLYAELVDAVESFGGRISFYLPRYLQLADIPIATFAAGGHEFGLHPYVEDAQGGDFGYTQVATWFASDVPVPPGPTARHHRNEWGGWVDPVSVMAGFGVRMDLSYYSVGPALDHPALPSQAHGYITGSGLPMKFVNQAGTVLPVYQQATSLTDEQLIYGDHSQQLSPEEALAVSRQLIDDSQAGGYSAIATQFQVQYYPFGEVKPWVDGTLAYAAGQQVPIWTAKRWLEFTEARAATTITNTAWNPGTGLLTFSIAVPAGAEPQSLMVPSTFAGKVLGSATIDAQTVAPTAMAVSGRTMQFIQVAPAGGGAGRQVALRYVLASSLPTVSIADGSAVEGDTGTSVGALTVTLSTPSATDVTVTFATSNGTATAGSDYQSVTNGFALIPAGATTAPAQVTLIGDTVYEADETVVVTLLNPVGATLADPIGVLTITNDEPIVAVADAYATAYVTTLTVPAPGVLGNDNANGQPGLTAVLISTTANGSLAFDADGSFIYTPNLDFAGVDTFTYRGDTATVTGNVVAVSITVAEPPTVQAPRELRAATIEGNVVTFRWKAAPRGPRPTGFVLEGGVAPAQPLVALPTGLAAPIFAVTAPNGSFFVRVSALGVGGPSPVSNEIQIHVGVPVPPSAPTSFQATAVGDGVHLAWAPTFAGGAASGFVLDVAGSISASVPLPLLERVSFAGAPAGSYTLSLRAANAAGTSASSPPVAMTVPGACSGPTGPPTNLLAYVAGGTTFVVWDPPTAGEAVTSYIISVPGIGGFPLAERAISGPLPAGTYVINVQAVGPCGTSTTATQNLTVP